MLVAISDGGQRLFLAETNQQVMRKMTALFGVNKWKTLYFKSVSLQTIRTKLRKLGNLLLCLPSKNGAEHVMVRSCDQSSVVVFLLSQVDDVQLCTERNRRHILGSNRNSDMNEDVG
jgi:hypothetical protein